MRPVSSAIGMKSIGGDDHAVALPPDQRFEPAHFAGRDLDDRLVVQPHLLATDRSVEAVLDVHAMGQLDCIESSNIGDAVAAGRLGAVRRDVGATHEFFGGEGAVSRCHRDAEAGGHEHIGVTDPDRLGEARPDGFDPRHGLGGRTRSWRRSRRSRRRRPGRPSRRRQLPQRSDVGRR